jgi:tetratricopeptide (TPR) repeat protein
MVPTARCAASQDAATQAQIADALLSAGYDFYEKGESRTAMSLWLDASHCSSRAPAWPKAVFNIGLTKQRAGEPASAISYFEMVLQSHPNDKEPGANIMEAYRNYSYYSALQISECYRQMGDYRRALQYARLAKNRYPYLSWCGTCQDEARMFINKRIAYLAVRANAPYVFTFIFIGGVVLIRRRMTRV